MNTLPDLGYVVMRGCIDQMLVRRAAQEAVRLGMMPPKGVRLYEEIVEGHRVPARVEGVVHVKGALGDLVTLAHKFAENATGRELAVFKDKVNFKRPGGGGFVAHQDSPAYFPHGSWHVSVLVPLVPFTKHNGTLEVHRRVPQRPMPELAALDYSLVPLAPGDCLVFDGLVPHRSGPNTTKQPRIGLYLTFVKQEEAGARDVYNAERERGTRGLSLAQVDFTGNLAPSRWLRTTEHANL